METRPEIESRTDMDALREDLEKLVLLEEVAERRQEIIEKRIAEALERGISPELLRSELGLSVESLDRLVDEDPPAVPERLGVSEQTAESLSDSPS
jgi:hypothetical protein